MRPGHAAMLMGRSRNSGAMLNISKAIGFQAAAHSGACQWIEGDGRVSDLPRCGKPGFPWCEEHRAMCFRKVPGDEA